MALVRNDEGISIFRPRKEFEMCKYSVARNLCRLHWTILACLLSVTTGCGGGDDGHRLSGKVTFDGAPIASGMIYFSPDAAKGNSGQSGFAKIENGEFDTAKPGGKPTIGGPSVIKIDGFDPVGMAENAEGDTSGEVVLKALFPTYETSADLPTSEGTQDFVVPAAAADRVDEPEVGKPQGENEP